MRRIKGLELLDDEKSRAGPRRKAIESSVTRAYS